MRPLNDENKLQVEKKNKNSTKLYKYQRTKKVEID